MKRAKKMMSGLLVLMMLAGLAVMPAGATETVEVVPNVVNGDFDLENGITDDEGVVTGIEGWKILDEENAVVSIVTEKDTDTYLDYPEGKHGNYLRLTSTLDSVTALQQVISGFETETPYQVNMRVAGGHDCIRFDVRYLGATTEDKAQYDPEKINYEKNSGTRNYCWNGKGTTTWARLSFNLILPKGCTGIELTLRAYKNSSNDTVCFDDIEIKKAVNLFSGVDVIANKGGKFIAADSVSHKVGTATWESWGMECGYEFWFGQKADGSCVKASMGTKETSLTTNAAIGQFVPLKNHTLYKLRFRQNSGTLNAGMKATISFAEDKSNGGATIVKSFTADSNTAYNRTYREAYIYVNGDFEDANGVDQEITEAKILFTTDEKTFWLEEPSLTEVENKDIKVMSGGTEVKEIATGSNTLSVTGTIYKKEFGGADEAILFVGVYEGNKLADIKVAPLACGENDSAAQTIENISVTKTEGVDVKLKAFLWDMENGMQPLETVTVQ